jgi:acetyl esterase/lipase
MRLVSFFLVLTLIALAGRVQSADEKPPVLALWPDKPPGETESVGEERDMTKPTEGKVAGQRVIRLGNVSKPTITVYRPSKEKETGTAVVVCPGGGYHILAMDLEGTEVCRWLNDLGVTAVLLKYRVPGRKGKPRHLAPLQDAQRAMSLVRSKATEWGIDPKRIGMLGFSAGGHLTATASTHYASRAYEPIDDADKVSCRPDFAVLVYPAYLVNRQKDALVEDLHVNKDTPPMFLAHAGDDPVPAKNSAVMYLALKRAGVPAELHLYASGGHGFGLRKTDKPCTAWPERCGEWMKARGLLKKSG